MTWPLLLLAVPTIIVGFPFTILPLGTSDVAKPVLERMLEYGEPVVRQVHIETIHQSHLLAMGASVLILLVGIGLGILYYAPPLPYVFRRRHDPREAAQRLGGLYGLFANKWYFDELYDAALVRPTLAVARLCSEFDRRVVDGVVNGSAHLTVLMSKLQGVFDNVAVDALVNLIARVVYGFGDWSRGLQTGRIRNYVMFLAVALVGLFVGVFAWIRP